MTRSSPDGFAPWSEQPGSRVSHGRSIAVRERQLIVRTAAAGALELALGLPVAAREQRALGLTRLTLRDAVDLAPVLARLRADDPVLATQTSPNYQLNPWVSSGGDDDPTPVTTAPPERELWHLPATVAVFDSGLLRGYGRHGFLANAYPVTGADVIDPSGPNGALLLYDSHGMFISGVVLCAAPRSTVRVTRAFDDNGQTDDWTLAHVIDDYLDAHPEVRLVNLSCGTYADRQQPPLALAQLVDAHPDVFFVAAAGNLPAGTVSQPSRPSYPAAYDTVVGVGAVTATGQVAPFTDTVSADVWAYGSQVVNAFGPGTLDGTSFPAGLASWSGTSFAAPLAAAALTELAGVGAPPMPPGYLNRARWAIAWLAARYRRPSDGRIVLPRP